MAEIVENGGGTNSNSTPVASEQGLTFNRRDFLLTGGTNKETTATGHEGEGFKSETVVIKEDTRQSYNNFMTNHFERIVQFKKDGIVANDEQGNPIKYEDLFGKNGLHSHEAAILDQIISEDGTRVDQAKLANFLKTSRGMMITTQLIEDVNAQKLFALALEGVKEPRGGRNTVSEGLSVKLGIDQGRLNKLADRIPGMKGVLTNVGLLASSTGGFTSLSALGAIHYSYLSGEPVSVQNAAVVGGGVGLLGGLLTGVGIRAAKSAMRDGVTLDLQRSVAGLEQLQRNPQEAAYIKALTGIDVHDYKVENGTLSVKPVTERVAESQRNPDDVREEVLVGMYARSHFLEDLGVDINKQDASPEQRFLKGRKNEHPRMSSEELGVHWQRMIEDEFKPNQGGVRDKLGRKPGDPFFGSEDGAFFKQVTVNNVVSYQPATNQEIQDYLKNINNPNAQPPLVLQNRRVKMNTTTGPVDWDPKIHPPLNTPNITFFVESGAIRDPNTTPTIGNNDFTSATSADISRLTYNVDNLDSEGNTRRYMEARKRVMSKMVDSFVQDEQVRQEKKKEEADNKAFSQELQEASKSIDQKLETLTEDGPAVKDREAELDAEKKKLEERKKEVDDKLVAFKGSGESQEKLQEVMETLTDEYSLVVGQNQTVEAAIDAKITTLLENLQGTQQNQANSLTYRLSALRTTYSDETVAEINRMFNALPQNMQRNTNALNDIVINAKKAVEIKYSTQIQELEGEIKSTQEQIKGLRENKQKYREAQKNIQSALREQVQQAQVNIDAMHQEVTKLTTNGITEVDLNTLSIEELVNRAEGLVDQAGIRIYQNRDQALQSVIQAKSEAQLRLVEISNGLYTVDQVKAYSEISGKGMTDIDTKTVDEILNEAYQNWGWNPTQDPAIEQQDRAHINNAIQYALLKKNTPEMKTGRYKSALELENKYIETRLKTLETKRQEVKTGVNKEAERLRAYKAAIPNIQGMSDRQGDIFAEAREEYMQNLDVYTSTVIVQQGDTKYTPAEQATGYPEGYFKTLDLIFKYQALPNRDEVFKHLKEILPPDKLATMLQQHLIEQVSRGPTGQGSNTLERKLQYIKNKRNDLSPSHYRRAFKGIINDLREEALAFTRL